MLNFDRPTVKHGTQNIQNDCHHSSFLAALEGTKFVFDWGSAPDSSMGSLQRSLGLHNWFKEH